MAAAGGAAGPIKTAFFTFGRFQPPTIGHEIMIDLMIAEAKAEGAEAFVFVSATTDLKTEEKVKKQKPSERKAKTFINSPKLNTNVEAIASDRNPLTSTQKVNIMAKQYEGLPVTIVDTEVELCRTVPEIIRRLVGDGFKKIVMYVGKDRENDFTTLLLGLQKYYTAELTVRAVPRPKGAMSATKVRSAAIRGNLEAFRNAVKFGAVTDENVEQLRKNVLAGMWLSPNISYVDDPRTKVAAAGAGGGTFAEGGRRRRTRRARKTRRTSRK